MVISKKVYDILKWCFRIVTPLAALYGAIASIWNLPYSEAIAATAAAITAFGNTVLMVDSSRYFQDKTIVNATSEDQSWTGM